MRNRTQPTIIGLLTAAGMLSPAVTLAQPEADTAAGETDEVIVVTGLRPETLAETAGSVTVIDATLIEARDAEHLEAVVGAAPNVTMTSGASRGRFVQIRGVGDLEQFVDPKHFPSVGVSIDGIDVGGIASAAMLFDVDQVEVLRGPQGTAFGASALAGQVNIVTAEPDDVFDAFVEAGVGDYGRAVLGFAAGGSISDAVSGRIAVQHHQGDGYIENAWLGRDDTNGYEETLLRAKLRWEATDSATLDFTAIEFDSSNGYDAFSLDNTRVSLADEPGRDELALSALGVTARWDLGRANTLVGQLNWLESETGYGYDEDWTYIGICDGTLCDPVFDFFSNTDSYDRQRDDLSVDLRVVGQSSGRTGIEHGYVFGLYAQDRSEDLARQYYGPFSSVYESDRLAFYAQIEQGLTRRLELTLGYRYERFEDSYSDSFAFVSESDDDLRSWEFALARELGDTSTIYGAVKRGLKPGGINTEASSVLPFVQARFQDFLQPRLTIGREELTSTEVGYTTTRAGGRLDIRAAVFQMARDQAQLESWFWDPVNYLWVGVLDNADGDNLGLEFDFDYDVSASWRLNGSLGLIDTEVDALETFDLDLDDFVVRDGIDQTKAPEWQVFIGSEWTLSRDWTVAADIEATDSHRYGYYHDATIGRATLVNASLKRTLGATELKLWARNLLDEDVAVHGLYFGNDPRKGWIPERYLQFGEPRLVGITVRHQF